MSVKLRLTRMGNKKRSFFRIVATNTASRRDGRPLEFLGYYNPQVSPADIKIDTDKVQKWMDLGAGVSVTVRSVMKQHAKKADGKVALRVSCFSATRSASAGRLGSFVFFMLL